MTREQLQALHSRQETMVTGAKSLESRKIATDGIGMVVGALVAKRSCGVGLMDHINPHVVKSDILALARRNAAIGTIAVIPAAGVLQAETRPGKHSHRLASLQTLVESRGQNDLILVEGVDYGLRSGMADSDITEYISDVINDNERPMWLTLGFTSRHRPERTVAGASHPVLAQLAQGFAVTNEGVVDQVYNPFEVSARHREAIAQIVGVPSPIERPLGRQRVGL
jgi:hypothetical protein